MKPLDNRRKGQGTAPLYRATRKIRKGNHLSFHVPLHGRGPGAPHLLRAGLGPLMQWDFTEVPPLDDLHQPTGVIQHAQQLAAQLFGAEKTYFLINGATVGLLAILMAFTRPGVKVLLTRLSHKAAMHGITLSGANPVYLPVEIEPMSGLPLNVTPKTVEKALNEHPDAQMLLVTSPSYWGVAANLDAIGEITKNRGVLLAVDEAHGAHLPFSQGKMPHAAGAGADLWIHSAHKSLGALTPGAYLHLAENTPSEDLSFWLQVLQTSSPPYPVMVSLDLARRQAAIQGRKIFGKTKQWALRFRRALKQKGVPVFSPARQESHFFLDPSRITILCPNVQGRSLGALFSRKSRILVEMQEEAFILMVVGPAALTLTPENLAQAIARAVTEKGELPNKNNHEGKGRAVYPFLHPNEPGGKSYTEAWKTFSSFALIPGDAVKARHEACALENSAGKISGEMIVQSPPGIPILAPGEIITGSAVDYLLSKRQKGQVFHGVGDPELNLIKVVTEVNNIC